MTQRDCELHAPGEAQQFSIAQESHQPTIASLPAANKGSHNRSDSPDSAPYNSINSWLHRTASLQERHSTPTGKRKRSLSAISSPSPPSHISKSFLDLQEIDFEMAGGNASNEPSTPQTSGKTKSKTTTLSRDQNWIKQQLRGHDMYQGDDEAFDLYPDFQTTARAILGGERNTGPRPDSKRKFKEKYNALKAANEGTLLDNLIPIIIPDQRSIGKGLPVQGSQNVEDSQDALKGAERVDGVEDFWDSGCVRARDVNFRPGFLPTDPELTLQMNKDKSQPDGMTNPRPDYLFGLRLARFAPPKTVKLTSETERLRQVVPVMYDPIFIIEGKGDKGEAAEAENQACRSGAALIRAARALRERIGEADVEGADNRTFLFSGTLSPGAMEIWVHWAQVQYDLDEANPNPSESLEQNLNVSQTQLQGTQGTPEGKAGDKGKNPQEQGTLGGQAGDKGKKPQERKKRVYYHMNILASESLGGPEFLDRMRPKCLNILDWGCFDRMSSNLNDLYQRVYAWDTKHIAEAANPTSTSDKAIETASHSPEARSNKRARS